MPSFLFNILFSDSIWLPWTDTEQEGKFISIHDSSKEIPHREEFPKWQIGEPNGLEVENCVVMESDRTLNDIGCKDQDHILGICKTEEEQTFLLRGKIFSSFY